MLPSATLPLLTAAAAAGHRWAIMRALADGASVPVGYAESRYHARAAVLCGADAFGNKLPACSARGELFTYSFVRLA